MLARCSLKPAVLALCVVAVLAACSGSASSIPGASPRAARPLPHVPYGKHLFYSRTSSAARRPHTTSNLEYFGGPVQTAPVIYLVFWGIASTTDTTHDPDGMAAYLINFYSSIGSSSWLSTVTQYYETSGGINTFITNPAAQYAGAYYDPSLPAHTYSDAQVQAEAIKAAGTLGYNINANYIVVTPTGYTIPGFAASSSNSFCAYHSATTYPGGSGSGMLSYTIIPYLPDAGYGCGGGNVNNPGTLDGASIVGGHEEAETQTDPDASSGWLDSSGNEIGDKCAWMNLQNTSFPDGQVFPTQPLWSNATSTCVQSYAPTPSPSSSPVSGASNAIVNGGFETGHLAPWKSCRSSSLLPPAQISTSDPHSGTYDAFTGKHGGEPNGTDSVCQEVTVPAGGVLHAWVRGVDTDPNHNVYSFGALFAPTGKLLKLLYTSRNTNANWRERVFPLKAFAGKRVYVAFGVVGTKRDAGKTVAQYIDDVSLIAP